MKKSPLLLIFLVIFIDLVGFGIMIPILPYYAKEFGASAFTLGWLMTSYSAMQFLFAPVWGQISDRVGRRPILLLSIFGSMCALCILGAAKSLVWLFIGRTFAGVCGANISTASAYIADVTSEKDRAKGMGIIGAAFGLGFVLGPAIGGILSQYGYSTPMFFAAGLAAINLIFAFFALPEPPVTAEERSKNRVRRFDSKTVSIAFGDQRSRIAILLFFIVTFAFTQMEVSFALFMKERHSLDAQGAGWLLAFMGLMLALIQGGLIGKLSRRFGEIRLIQFGTVSMACALVVMALGGSLNAVVFAMVFVAIGNGLNNPSLSSLASKGADTKHRGATMGVYQSAGSLARVFGPPVAGALYDRVSLGTPFLAAAGLMLLAFGVAFWFSIQGRLFMSRRSSSG